MANSTNWELVEDQIAIQEGKLPTALRHERRARVPALMDEVMQLAAKLGASRAELAGELGVDRISLYRWQDGSAIPSLKNYRNLLGLWLRLQKQVHGKRV